MSSVEEKVCLLGRDRSTSLVREYNSIGVTLLVEQDEDHEPLILHDLTGPIAPQPDHVEKHDDLVSFVSSEDWDAEDLDLEGFPQSDIDGQATLSSEIASMTKNLIGCGALSLANGIALSSNSPNGVFAGVFWILLFGVVFGYFCWLIAKVCQMTGHTTYRGIWQATVGLEGALAVSIANALKAALADLAYATILSDTMGSLFDATGWKVPRTVCLLLVTICGILPLCMLENLHVLAPFSLLGTAGVVFTAGAMGIRYIDGSYKPGGIFYDDIDPSFQPEFGNIDNSWSMAILPFVCMCYEAYVMHYNSARFYTELKGKTLPRFGIAVGSSFSISAVMYVVIASFGYLTFGGNSSGYILNNYSPYDPLATISRLAIGVSTLTAYPIVFFGVRDGCLDVFEVPLADQTPEKLKALTYAFLGVLTFTAVFVTDLGLINAVGGGLVASMIVFVFPTIMFGTAVLKRLGDKKSDTQELLLPSGLTVFGVLVGVFGAWTAIQNVLR